MDALAISRKIKEQKKKDTQLELQRLQAIEGKILINPYKNEFMIGNYRIKYSNIVISKFEIVFTPSEFYYSDVNLNGKQIEGRVYYYTGDKISIQFVPYADNKCSYSMSIIKKTLVGGETKTFVIFNNKLNSDDFKKFLDNTQSYYRIDLSLATAKDEANGKFTAIRASAASTKNARDSAIAW